MKAPSSIGRYIGVQVALLFSVLIVIYSLSINKVYDWGIFDMTHYFLSLQAEELSHELSGDELKNRDEFPVNSDSHTQYYLNFESVPLNIKALFPVKSHQNGEMLKAKTPRYTYYFLPYENPKNNGFFYILHTYSEVSDEYEVAIDIPSLQIMLLLFVAFLVFLLVRNVVLAIVKPVENLERWARSIDPESNVSIDINTEKFRFKELQLVADRLADSVSKLESYHQREKDFLRTLSHELRTPLAITHAALDLLQQDTQQPLTGDALKFERMRRANNHMLATTECLLWLWRGKQRDLEVASFDVRGLVEQAVNGHQYLLQHKAVKWVLEIPDGLIYTCEKKLLKMVLENLVRNAFQYTQSGDVHICASEQGLEVINQCVKEDSPAQEQTEDYGYGVGLYLVEKICEQKGWIITVTKNRDNFKVCMVF
jgi:signal transduction histidine kinase